MNEPYDLIQTVLDRKGDAAWRKAKQVCFRVSPRANKLQIKRAIELLFKKKVIDVNTANYAGKKKRHQRR